MAPPALWRTPPALRRCSVSAVLAETAAGDAVGSLGAGSKMSELAVVAGLALVLDEETALSHVRVSALVALGAIVLLGKLEAEVPGSRLQVGRRLLA